MYSIRRLKYTRVDRMKGETHISTIIFGHFNSIASEIGKNIDYFYDIFKHDRKQSTKKIHPVFQNGL